MSRLVRIFTVAALGLSVAVPPVAVPKAAYAAPRPAPLDGDGQAQGGDGEDP
ncbi:MAG: hypothetical protein H2037_17280, partial [Brevundimonas sp.]|nr:hypothetical protein [Brevundimonas sp.]